MRRIAALAAATLLVVAACGSSDETEAESGAVDTTEAESGAVDTTVAAQTDVEEEGETQSDELFPDVIGATAQLDADGTWTFDATLSSPYDSPERYADAWRVVGPDGTVYGTRELLHDHANEQPFTRSVSGVEIPDDISTVTVEGRDQVSGWGGETATVELER